MAKVKHLLNRDGRYFARLVIPKDLRPYLDNKTELRESLGPDRRSAMTAHYGAMARLQEQVATANRKMQIAKRLPAEHGRYPLTADQIALRNYKERLAFDEQLRNMDSRHSRGYVDEILVATLRNGIAGSLTNDEYGEVVGPRIERYRFLGNTTVAIDSDEWRALARAMCISEYEALSRVAERDDGDFSGKIENPMLASAVVSVEAIDATAASFNQVTFEAIIQEQERITGMGLGGNEKSAATLKKYRFAVREFEHFRRSKHAATVTLEDGESWRDAMLNGGKHSRKTVRDKIGAIRAVLAWGHKQSRGKLFPGAMPFDHLDLPVAEVIDSADRTYTLEQARKVLEAARLQTTRPNFRWIPWLLAHTGMRVGEALQLEKSDVFEVEGRWFLFIRVGKGRTTKTNKSRKVPVHSTLVEEGFIDFVSGLKAGPLFPGTFQDQRIREWIREDILKDYPDSPPPNHGFRHLFEDALFAGVTQKAALYITGRATGSSADDYGGSDLRLMELARQMDKVGRFII